MCLSWMTASICLRPAWQAISFSYLTFCIRYYRSWTSPRTFYKSASGLPNYASYLASTSFSNWSSPNSAQSTSLTSQQSLQQRSAFIRCTAAWWGWSALSCINCYLNQINFIMRLFPLIKQLSDQSDQQLWWQPVDFILSISHIIKILSKGSWDKMTLYLHDDSSYARTEQLQLSSKLELKQEDESDEISELCLKIYQMEKNYIAMEKHYADKIKQLYTQINEKDQEFKKLKNEMEIIRGLASDHRKKAEQLSKNAIRKSVEPRIKSKSPVVTARSNNNKPSTNTNNVNNVETEAVKSPSPKHEVKKISPTHKPAVPKRPTLVTKTSLGSSDSGNMLKNTSSQKFMKKSVSPKNSYEKSKKVLPKVDEVESIKIAKKPGGVTSFREKAPAFK